MLPPVAPVQARSGERFLTNVLWGWLGVAANLAVGLLLAPYIIRRLGEERYGIWALIFAIIEYLWFFDLGFNTAVVNFSARFQARNEPHKINELINTALFYFTILALALMAVIATVAGRLPDLFRVSPGYRQEFATLILLTGVSWGLCMIFQVFVASLDGFQRFDLTGRVAVGMTVLRSSAYAVLLAMGYGLVEMALAFIAAQILGYVLNFLNFRRAFREFRLSAALVRLSMFRQILSYGVHSFMANASTLALNQSGPVLIGMFRPAAFVGFYALPSRLLQHAVEAVARIALVTRSSAAELCATGRGDRVLKLGIYSNRYSFALFLPLVLVLLVYGRELILLWVGPRFAEHSAPLLPVLLLGTAFVTAGQFNSSAILFGLARHGGFARGLLVEAVLNVALLLVVIPRYGILGAAWVSSGLRVLVRGLYTPWLLCRCLNYSFRAYMLEIYGRPLLTALPVLALGYALKRQVPGNAWGEVLAVSAAIAAIYVGLAFFTCIEPEHRELLLARMRIVSMPLRNLLRRA
jgi:O-antigen/teichoic acid export membrane protein